MDFGGYGQVHAFCGIGGWPLAARMAGWPEDAPLWTGSCPCQPFSVAGQLKGEDDDRHLWPAFLSAITEQEPPVVVGEQVAGTAGRQWVSGVRSDLEEAGYAVGIASLPACSVGLPHKRERIYWSAIRLGHSARHGLHARERSIGRGGAPGADGASPVARLEHPDGLRFFSWGAQMGSEASTQASDVDAYNRCELVECSDGTIRQVPVEPELRPLSDGVSNRVVRIRAYGNAVVPAVAAIFLRAVMGCLDAASA